MDAEEAKAICEKIWKESNTWDLSIEDMIELSFTPGDDPGDEVYMHPKTGAILSRAMCDSWVTHYYAFESGFLRAVAHYKL